MYSSLQNLMLGAAILLIIGSHQMHAADPAAIQKRETKETKAAIDGSNVSKMLQGKWTLVRMEEAGREVPEDTVKALKQTITFADKSFVQMSVNDDDEPVKSEGLIKLDTAKSPWQMDWSEVVLSTPDMPEGEKLPYKTMGIFEITGSTLKIHCVAHRDGKGLIGDDVQRPTDFKKSAPGVPGDLLMILERIKP